VATFEVRSQGVGAELEPRSIRTRSRSEDIGLVRYRQHQKFWFAIYYC